jgi:N-acetylglucosamine kinase-like BadF-type ATPase
MPAPARRTMAPMGRPVVLGIDGGGTRSEGRVWAGGEEVARAAGGALNPNHAGVGGSGQALRELLAGLCIGVSGARERLFVDAACVGLSGASHPSARNIVQEAFRTAEVSVGGAPFLGGDGELVLGVAFGAAAPSGVVLIAGTGSIALARVRTAAVVRAGGLGPDGGDRGGGHWIGGEALAAGLVQVLPGAPGRNADLAPEVVRLADRGDPRALAIVRRAAAELAALVAEVASPFEVRPSGGLVTGATELRRSLAVDLARIVPPATLLDPVGEPVLGALKLATRVMTAGSAVPPGW